MRKILTWCTNVVVGVLCHNPSNFGPEIARQNLSRMSDQILWWLVPAEKLHISLAAGAGLPATPMGRACMCQTYKNKHDKLSRSPGPSCTFWAPQSTHFAWNSYTAVYSSLCTLYTCSAPDQLFVLYSWSITDAWLASVEVSLTILKTENR